MPQSIRGGKGRGSTLIYYSYLIPRSRTHFPKSSPPGLTATDPDSLNVFELVLFPINAGSKLFYHQNNIIVKL